MVELRRYERRTLNIDVEFHKKGGESRHSGRAKDISIGGMFVETEAPLAFRDELLVHFALPGHGTLALPAVVRWTRADGMGIQFGLLGARETHAITEVTKTP